MSSVVLYYYRQGINVFYRQWIDEMGDVAFTMHEVSSLPTPIIKLQREPKWAQQYQHNLGPDVSWLYLGPEKRPGYVCYGSNPTNHEMKEFRKQKCTGSSSRFFTSRKGKEYKWKITPAKMECTDSRTTVAVWERSKPEEEHQGKLTLMAAVFSVEIEIMTSLVLSIMAADLNWD